MTPERRIRDAIWLYAHDLFAEQEKTDKPLWSMPQIVIENYMREAETRVHAWLDKDLA